MDFVFKLPPIVQRHDDIWVVVDRLTKSAHIIPIREKFSPQKLAELFMNHIVGLHDVPVSIICDRDPRFHFEVLEGIDEGTRYQVEFEYRFSPSDRWTI